jgi:hypothetical protein
MNFLCYFHPLSLTYINLVKTRNYELCNSIQLCITSSLSEIYFLITLLLNAANLFSFLNMKNLVSNTNNQHLKLYITYLIHCGFIQETIKVKYESHNSWRTHNNTKITCRGIDSTSFETINYVTSHRAMDIDKRRTSLPSLTSEKTTVLLRE